MIQHKSILSKKCDANFNFGVKLWSNNTHLINAAYDLVNADFFSYVELTVIPGTEVSDFLAYDIPYIIHATTDLHGLNIASKMDKAKNLEMVNQCSVWADMLEAPYIILHPGVGIIEDAIDFLDDVNDARIIIENMPMYGIHHETLVGYSPEQIRTLKSNKFGFCFDINHAIKASISLNIDYHLYLQSFLDLKPMVYHISDGKLTSDIDEHLDINAGDYDFPYIFDNIFSNPYNIITIETQRLSMLSLNDDLINRNALYELVT